MEAAAALQVELQGWDRQMGEIVRPDRLILFVTLDKTPFDPNLRFQDTFTSPTEFQWQSQNKTRQESEVGQRIRHHRDRGIDVHLFVRRRNKVRGTAMPFYYCGRLDFERWEGEKPITVWWRLEEAVPERLWGELGAGA